MMNEWYFQQPSIDYRLLAEAISFYADCGYEYLETPWIVDFPYVTRTRPLLARDYFTLDGYLIASGEQSLMSAMRSGIVEAGRKYQTVTPCFRDDAIDELHQKWFLKLELMHYSPSLPVHYGHVYAIMADANNFMGRHIATQRVSPLTDDDPESEHGAFIYDLESKEGIELGSYGYRTWGADHWIYGTGLALPRFTIAQQQQSVTP